MNQLNSILIEGNLVRDPETKVTKNWKTVCTFSIATNRYFKSAESYKEETSFFIIETWGKTAEICSEHLTKGKAVRVVGRLKQSRWESNGQSRSRIIIIAEHVEFKSETPKQKAKEGEYV